MAVGGSSMAGTMVPFAERWTGSRWTRQRVPQASGASSSELSSVSCGAPDSCVAVGRFSRFGPSLALAEGWNGKGWAILKALSVPGWDTELAGVSCPARQFCVAVGDISKSTPFTVLKTVLVEQWNGSSWRIVPTPKLRGGMGTGYSAFASVSCTSRYSCTAVGSDGTELWGFWQGRRWRIRERSITLDGGDLNAVSCVKRVGCSALGFDDGTSVGASFGFVAGWNHERGFGGNAISCVTRSACMVVGPDPTASSDYWDGRQWTPQTAPLAASLAGVSCVRPRLCTAVGSTAAGLVALRYS